MSSRPTLLLCRPDRVGDVIIATSCLEVIRRQRPEYRIVFVAREVMRPLLEGHPLLDGFISLPIAENQKSGAKSARPVLADQFRLWQAEAVVHFHPDAACQTAARAAGIPRRIGYRHGFFMDRTLTDRVPDRRREGCRHEAEYNFDVLAPLGVQPPTSGGPELPLRPRVHLAESWRTSLRLRFAAMGWEDFDNGETPYAVLNPTAHSADLRWPAADFAWLARELMAGGRFEKIVWVADRQDDPSIRELRRLLGPGVPGLIDLSGATNLAELGWLLRSASLLVSRNTGTTHLAAAVGCPTVELFGRAEPTYAADRWRALGGRIVTVNAPAGRQRWNESRRAFWRRSHASIPREGVLAAALRLTETRPSRQADAD